MLDPLPQRNSAADRQRAQLQAADALNAQSAGTLLGPFLSGLLAVGAGAGWATAISSAIGAGLLLLMRVQAEVPARPTTRMLVELRAGWTEFTRRLWVWLAVVQFALFHLLVDGPMQVLGALDVAHMPGGALRWGLLTLRLRPRRPVQVSLPLFLLYGAMPASPAACWPYLAQASCFLHGGLARTVLHVLRETTLQQAIPTQMS